MTTKQLIGYVLSLTLVAGAVFLFGDGLRLLAEWREGVLNAIFLMLAGAVGAILFAYRAGEVRESTPVSIVSARPVR